MSEPVTSKASLAEMTIFHGRATSTVAHVYARVAGAAFEDGYRLSGYVHGPFCESAHTLPAKIPLRGLGPGVTLLAQAVIPDPCPWTSDLPGWYRVHVKLQKQHEVVETAEQEFGFRFLGSANGRLYRQARRWVLRAIYQASIETFEVEQLRDLSAALVIDHPGEDLCRSASRAGAMLVARVRGDDGELESELRRLARWVAVGVAIVDGASPHGDQLRTITPNLLMAQQCPDEDLCRPASWADLAICTQQEGGALGRHASTGSLPLVLSRPLDNPREIRFARTEIDRLQRDAGGLGDFAGFVV